VLDRRRREARGRRSGTGFNTTKVSGTIEFVCEQDSILSRKFTRTRAARPKIPELMRLLHIHFTDVIAIEYCVGRFNHLSSCRLHFSVSIVHVLMIAARTSFNGGLGVCGEAFSFTAQLQVDLKSLLHGRRQPIGAAESIQPCELDVSVRVVNAYFMIYKRCSQA
jgi:hypothetical protein